MTLVILLILGGAAAGGFGSLLGLGGGILLIPLLTLGFELPLREAVGVSLVSVIVTSGTAAAVYLDRGVADLRLGMSLELFTASGALLGAFVAFLVSEQLIAALFAGLLVYTAFSMVRGSRRATPAPSAGAASAPSVTAASGADPARAPYEVRHRGRGAAASLGAGVISAMLGVGGGIVMVPVMHLGMGVPLRVATATSNLMIGVTASAAAIVYLARGGIDPYVVGPVAVGVFVGASVGSRAAHRIDVRWLRMLFVVVLLYSAVLMFRRGVGIA